MGFKRWQDLQHPGTPADRAERKKEALAEYDRMGYASLRKARSLTQVEMASRLDISQGSVAMLEARTDLHLSTLARYIRAMGGELQMRAVFPEATFDLEPPPRPLVPETPKTATSAKRKPAAPSKAKAAGAPKRRAAVAS